MPDGAESPTYEAIRALLVVPGLRARLIRHAYARCGSVTNAQDIVQEAIKKVLEGSAPWREKELIDHLGSVINTVAWNRANSAAAKREGLYRPEHAERIVDGAPNPEQALIEREEARELALLVQRCLAALRMRLQGDDVALIVLDCFEHGVESADEQAETSSKSRDEIDKARRRLGYSAEIVMRAERRGGGVAVAQGVAP